MLSTAYQHPGPAAVRYPRGSSTGGSAVPPAPTLDTLEIGKGEIRRHGRSVAILAFGTLLAVALDAGEILDATVANMRFVKPLDVALIRELAQTHDLLITLEENAVIGGAGAEVARALEGMAIVKPLHRLGLPDYFIEHGEQGQMLAELGLNSSSLVQRIKALLATIS
jgi:1-deoxy-D-xylulose-5-phosphate synthase